MMNIEQTLTPSIELSWSDKLARNLFFRVLRTLPEGQLVIRERGHLIAEFGPDSEDLKAEINILDPIVYRKLLIGGSVGSGETFTDKGWETPNLTNVIRLFARNLPTLDAWENKFKWISVPFNKLGHWRNRNTERQAKANISAHYDLGNELYTRFLDDSMMYSAAIYEDEKQCLATAQEAKLKAICEKLKLTEGDHLLEIGTGWGGLAVYAASHYGCKVTTTTISEEQFAFAKERVAQADLGNKITLLKQDYRTLEGQFDKLVSIEMIEAVGREYLPTYFEKCSTLLKPHGMMLLQAITIDDRRYDTYSKGVDFIQKHIFPGGFLPSVSIINQHVKNFTDMVTRDLHDFGLSYAYTLKHWHDNLLKHKQELSELGYDERFMRLWRYYFCYCEGGFLERSISVVQTVLTKPGYRDALARG